MKGKEYEFDGIKVETEYTDEGIPFSEAIAEAVNSTGNRALPRQ